MKYIDLSKENVREKNKYLYDLIIKEYNYDLVVFIAKGSYIIGKDLAELNNTPLLEIFATRKGNKLKKILSPMLRIIPAKIKAKLREKEMNSKYHTKNTDRKISFDKKKYSKYKNRTNILLVDDSIDTGNSIKLAYNTLIDYFPNASVKIAVFNVMDKAYIKPDFTLYKDTMISGPWSSDSKEHKEYIDEYLEWSNK